VPLAGARSPALKLKCLKHRKELAVTIESKTNTQQSTQTEESNSVEAAEGRSLRLRQCTRTMNVLIEDISKPETSEDYTLYLAPPTDETCKQGLQFVYLLAQRKGDKEVIIRGKDGDQIVPIEQLADTIRFDAFLEHFINQMGNAMNFNARGASI
jgi:hypothetical protein